MSAFRYSLGLSVMAVVTLMLPWPAFFLSFFVCVIAIVSSMIGEFAANLAQSQQRRSIAVRDIF